MTRHRWLLNSARMLIVSGVLVAVPACAAPAGRIYVRGGPPRPGVEARVVSPGPGYVWVSGNHTWNNSAYVWAPGRWELPPRPRAAWVPGHWVHARRGWYFQEGHWR